jgi:hypothetical protein
MPKVACRLDKYQTQTRHQNNPFILLPARDTTKQIKASKSALTSDKQAKTEKEAKNKNIACI